MKKDTNFSKFFHKASSKEKKKVFKKVIKKATEEQINIMNKSKSKVKRMKEIGWAVYSDMGGSITQKVVPEEDAYQLWKDTVYKGMMPKETWEKASKRYHIVKVTITYTLPTKKK